MEIDIKNIPTYFINLDKDLAKRRSTTNVLSELGINNITRVAGIPDKNSRLGCTMAHAKALSVALKDSSGPFLIVEDDILIRNSDTVFEVPDTADALYLGISRWGLYGGKGHRQIAIEKYNDDMYRLYNMLSAHAIIYFSHDYVKMLLRSYQFYIDTHDVQDKANAELMKYYEIYGLTNPVFYQQGINEKETNFSLPGPNSFDKFHSFLLK